MRIGDGKEQKVTGRERHTPERQTPRKLERPVYMLTL